MAKRCLLAVFLFSVPLDPCRGAHDNAGHWIVVTAPAFQAAITPLVTHRKSQGFQVSVVQTNEWLSPAEIQTRKPSKLRDRIRALLKQTAGPNYVLLVGAVEADGREGAVNILLPPLPGTVGRMKDQPSDNGFGCLSEALTPTVAVGRFPARTVREAEEMVQKTVAFERDGRPGQWRRRITVLAGVPAFNPIVDKLVEGLAMARLDGLDPCWTGRAIYHNPQSRFCVPDGSLHDQALAYVQEGEAITLYLGHSSPRGLYARGTRFLDRQDWASLRISTGRGVFVTFGCNGCQLQGRDGEGYGVAAFRNPYGPVAVIGSHGICFAAMVQLAADALFENLARPALPPRLGDAWLLLKKGLAQGKIDPISFRLLDAVDGDNSISQATQRLEHLEMFLLLGDPALQLPLLPNDVRLHLAESAAAGETIAVRGEAPPRLEGAKVQISLERPPTTEPEGLQPLPPGGAERDRVMAANHELANRFVVAAKETMIRNGRFSADLVLPLKLPWRQMRVRAYAATDKCDSQGVALVRIRTSPATR